MTSTLTLIYNSPLLPERNFKVPSLYDAYDSEYGSTISTISDFQYVKHSLDLTIKIDEVQEWGLEYESSQNLNYLIVQHKNDIGQDVGQPVGYFVTNKRWIAESTIELTLHCDVLNSFIDRCELSPKTRILRQHKDRFNIPEYSYYDHIEDVISVASQIDKDEGGFLWYWTQGKSIFQGDETIALYDISLNGSYYEDEDENRVYPNIYLTINEAVDCLFYFADANGTIISQIGDQAFNFAYGKITYSQTTGHAHSIRIYENQSAGGQPLTSEIFIPENAKYIVMRMTLESGWTIPDMFASAQVEDWEDLQDEHEAKYDEFMLHFTNDYFTKSADFVEGNIPADAHATIKIDQYSEGITPMLFGRWERYIVESEEISRQSWYLVYMNQNDPTASLTNPINCLLVPQTSQKVQAASDFNGTKSYNELVSALCAINGLNRLSDFTFDNGSARYKGLYFTAQNNEDGVITYGTDFSCILQNGKMVYIEVFVSDSDEQYIYILEADENGVALRAEEIEPETSVSFSNMIIANIAIVDDTADDYPDSAEVSSYPMYDLFNTSTATLQNLFGITEIDRTDPKLIKIIKLPYCPARVWAYEFDGSLGYDSSEWEYSSEFHALKLKNINTIFSRYLVFNDDVELGGINPYYPLVQWHKIGGAGGIVDSKNARKSYLNEPKLYHSDYYQPKVIYDSFSFTFQLELINYAENLHHFFIKYDVSNTCNSRFMFTFDNYTTALWDMRDYNNIMLVSRNNEISIFNQQFLNYLRTGYNYDKKANEILYEQANTNWLLNLPSKIIGAAKSGIGQYERKDYLGVAGTMYSAGVGSYLDNYNIAVGVSMREMQLAAKRTQLANQATGVIDSNDVDLMSCYARNRLKYKLYQVSEKMQKVLFDLFYYNGYVAEVDGIPDTTSRIRFNFVQAEIVLKKVPNLPTNIVNEIKDKYAEGITFMHKFEGEFDWNQELENWESKFFD